MEKILLRKEEKNATLTRKSLSIKYHNICVINQKKNNAPNTTIEGLKVSKA
jgi:hypothetical protein